jgi:hypothetical protein
MKSSKWPTVNLQILVTLQSYQRSGNIMTVADKAGLQCLCTAGDARLFLICSRCLLSRI